MVPNAGSRRLHAVACAALVAGSFSIFTTAVQAQVIETQRTGSGTNVSRQQIEQLPTSRRNFEFLATLEAGGAVSGPDAAVATSAGQLNFFQQNAGQQHSVQLDGSQAFVGIDGRVVIPLDIFGTDRVQVIRQPTGAIYGSNGVAIGLKARTFFDNETTTTLDVHALNPDRDTVLSFVRVWSALPYLGFQFVSPHFPFAFTPYLGLNIERSTWRLTTDELGTNINRAVFEQDVTRTGLAIGFDIDIYFQAMDALRPQRPAQAPGLGYTPQFFMRLGAQANFMEEKSISGTSELGLRYDFGPKESTEVIVRGGVGVKFR
jgi:hypothetical protein